MHKLHECVRSKKSSRGIAGQGRMVSTGLFARSAGGGGQKRKISRAEIKHQPFRKGGKKKREFENITREDVPEFSQIWMNGR